VAGAARRSRNHRGGKQSNRFRSTRAGPRQAPSAPSAFAVQRLLLILGCLFFAAAAAWPWLSRLPFGRLPGDIHIVRDGFSFYFPITTCILVSLLLSILLWLIRR